MLPSVFAVVLAATAPPPAPGACSLVDPDVVAAAQGTRVVSTKESRAKGARVDRRACYYQADPPDRSVSLEWTSDSVPGGARTRWQETFHGEGGRGRGRERGEQEERGKTPPAPVPGVGDEAFWVGNPASGALYALAGSSFVRVSVGGPGTPDEKRDRARTIALRAVAAIPGAGPGTGESFRPAHASPRDLR